MLRNLIMVIVCLVVSSLLVIADDSFDDEGNPNDPTINIRANACFDEGSLAGKCDSDLMWTAGWYLIRLEQGIFSAEDIPSFLWWILPQDSSDDSSTSPTSPSIEPSNGCYDNGSESMILTSETDQKNNTVIYDDLDCTTVAIGSNIITVTGSNEINATTACQNLLASNQEITTISNWSTMGYNTPNNWWLCTFSESAI
ncbi:MAG: hypothetical protein WBC91_05700 [Phototrophicaceae bacterium]